MKIAIGGIIEKDGKYLLVQEAERKWYKKWNFPAGHLENNESLEEGAIREIKEETGCDVKLNGICYIGNKILKHDIIAMIIFSTELINENIKYDKKEILDAKWYTYDEILNDMDDMLRTDIVKTAIKNAKNKAIAPMDIIGTF